MRLLLLTSNYPSHLHPTRSPFNERLVEGLRRIGSDVRVVCPLSWVSKVRARKRGLQGTDSRAASREVEFPTFYYPPSVLRSIYGTFMWMSVGRTVKSVLDRFRPEAVVGYWAHPDGECAVRAAELAGVPSVIMVGGSDVLLLTKNPARRRSILRALGRANAVVSVSEDIRVRLIELGVDPGRISVVRRGIDSERFHPGDRDEARRRLELPCDRRVALWVGRMERVKGLDVLVDAVRRIRDGGNVPPLVQLVGDGAERPALEQAVSGADLGDHVHFSGPVAHDQLPDWFRAADVTVLPSRSEGVPNVLLESIACGTPFVASDVGGIPEIATPGLDALVPPGDSKALADALGSWLESPPKRIDRVFAPYSWDDSARRLRDVLEAARARTEPPRTLEGVCT